MGIVLFIGGAEIVFGAGVVCLLIRTVPEEDTLGVGGGVEIFGAGGGVEILIGVGEDVLGTLTLGRGVGERKEEEGVERKEEEGVEGVERKEVEGVERKEEEGVERKEDDP